MGKLQIPTTVQGLLITTQQECQKGISGEGKGMCFSEIQDWTIV